MAYTIGSILILMSQLVKFDKKKLLCNGQLVSAELEHFSFNDY